jgi:hypothetical protein
VIIDLTSIRAGTGPARLLDMVEGRSKQAFKTWLAERPQTWRDGHRGGRDGWVHRLQDRHHRGALRRGRGDGPLPRGPPGRRRLDQCRRRVQQAIHGHRGYKDDPLYWARRTLHTGADLLTDRQCQRLCELFAADAHVEVEATWGIYQQMFTAYRAPDRTIGRDLMAKLIGSISHGVPAALNELTTLGRTLTKRADDVLAYFDRPGTSNGPTEAITAGSNTSEDPPSDSATSPTTSPDPYSRPVASDPDYIPDCEEPVMLGMGAGQGPEPPWWQPRG